MRLGSGAQQYCSTWQVGGIAGQHISGMGRLLPPHEHCPCFFPWICTISLATVRNRDYWCISEVHLCQGMLLTPPVSSITANIPSPWLVSMANAPAVAMYQKQLVGLSWMLTFPFISLSLLFRSHLATCVQTQVLTNTNQLLTRLGFHLSFLWTFLAIVLDSKEQNITWFS